MRTHTYLLQRHSEDTHAVLKLSTELRLSDDQAFDAFRRGVRDWTEETEEGRSALEDACDDLNVGDLSNSDDSGLTACLRKHGIFEYELEVNMACTDYHYDTHLHRPDDASGCVKVAEGA